MNEILQEQNEVERRKLNLLIFEAPEAVEEASKVEDIHHDLLFMNDVLNEMKIDTTVSNTIRHGKRMKDRAKPLQIIVPSAEVKTEILKKTKLLRQGEDSNIKKISISPDRTPNQRKEVKALLADMIRRRGNGENVALVDDNIKTFPTARRGTGGGGTTGGAQPSDVEGKTM